MTLLEVVRDAGVGAAQRGIPLGAVLLLVAVFLLGVSSGLAWVRTLG